MEDLGARAEHQDTHTNHMDTVTYSSNSERSLSGPINRAYVKALLIELSMAKKELDFANRQFDEVADPAAIDEIIFRITAAERKFDRLYQVAKNFNVTQQDLRQIWPDWEFFGTDTPSL